MKTKSDRMTTPNYIYHSCEFMDDGTYTCMNKLREYEDAEQAGKIIHIPVAVGDHVKDKYGEEYVVSYYAIHSNYCGIVEYSATHVQHDIIVRFTSDDIGKTIFV